MSFVQLRNLAGSSLVAGIGPEDSELLVQATDAERFPSLALPGDCFFGCLVSDGGNHEYVRAVARDGNRITVERGQEGTSALLFPAGTRFELRVTAKAWELLAANRWQRPRAADGSVLLPTRVDAQCFTLPGDQIGLFQPNRALHLLQTNAAYGFVLAADYAQEADSTMVTVQDCSVDTGLSYVELGLDAFSAPKYGQANQANMATHADDAARLDGRTRAQIMAEARSVLGTAARRDVGNQSGQVPLMEHLGTAATRDVGTAPGNVPVLDAEGKLAEGVLPGGSGVIREFITSTQDWTVPSGITEIRVWVIGGGAAGDGINQYQSAALGGSGGSGGGCAYKVISGLSSGTMITCTIGAAKSGTSGPGTDGNTSSFGAYCSATGGTSYRTNAGGGVGVGGDINYRGSYGESRGDGYSGYGGSAGGPWSGAGGNRRTAHGDGYAGQYGGGGGGSFSRSGSATNGGTGSAGLVVIEYSA
ncbi:MAG: hypothetical protein AB7D47_04305 [Desulfovibrio sp.]|jgi:hypothetical protein